jgi:prophage regulatory protein
MSEQKESILRFPKVNSMTGLSRSTIWRLEQSGDFPKRVQLSPNAVGWRESDIRDWQSSRIAV